MYTRGNLPLLKELISSSKNTLDKHFLILQNRIYSVPGMAAILKCQQFISKMDLVLFGMHLIWFVDLNDIYIYIIDTKFMIIVHLKLKYIQRCFFMAAILNFPFLDHKMGLKLFDMGLIRFLDLNNIFRHQYHTNWDIYSWSMTQNVQCGGHFEILSFWREPLEWLGSWHFWLRHPQKQLVMLLSRSAGQNPLAALLSLHKSETWEEWHK